MISGISESNHLNAVLSVVSVVFSVSDLSVMRPMERKHKLLNVFSTENELVTARIRSMTGRHCFHRCLSVNISGGGTWSQIFGGGTWSQIFGGGGGTWSQIFRGRGTWSQIFGGGTWSQIFGGGVHLVSENCYGYTAGGMPLAFTQEDFLVTNFKFSLFRVLTRNGQMNRDGGGGGLPLQVYAPLAFQKIKEIKNTLVNWYFGQKQRTWVNRSAGVTPEVNLGNPLRAGEKYTSQGSTLALKPSGQTSPEVQNRGISAPQKWTCILKTKKTWVPAKGVMCVCRFGFPNIVSNDTI